MASSSLASVEDDDMWGARAFFLDKGNLFSIGNWIAMVSGVEGRDKLLKAAQFAARIGKWQSAQHGSESGVKSWQGLMLSIQEGRKSVRILKGINKVDQCFTEVPAADSLYEKALILGNHLSLAFLWHWDYLAHGHRAGFLRFKPSTYNRLFQAPGFVWSLGNICQILLGFHTLRKAATGIASVREELRAASAQLKGELEARLKALQIQRFKGWILILKGIADMCTSGSMPGPELQKRFPALFSWLNEPVIGLSGVISSACVLLTNFPTKAASVGKEPGGLQTHQNERNAAAAIFAFMQVSTMIRARGALA